MDARFPKFITATLIVATLLSCHYSKSEAI